VLLCVYLLAVVIPKSIVADSPDLGERIVLRPRQGHMGGSARVPALDGQVFALGIPETIGCRERMILNFPEVDIRWTGPDEEGAITSEADVVTATNSSQSRMARSMRLSNCSPGAMFFTSIHA
jgi:hypothetical protein